MTRSLRWLTLIVLLTLGSASRSENETPPPAMDAYAELARLDTFSEIMRHLYRWYLDEKDFEGAAGWESLHARIRPMNEKLDEGDRSLYADIFIPRLSVAVTMKKTDYTIEEMGSTVRSDRFKIVNVEQRIETESEPEPQDRAVDLPMRQIMEYLFATRAQPDYPSPELEMRLRQSVQHQLGPYTNKLTGDRIVYVAPLSPVANEVWVYVENVKVLIRWASDIELDNPAVWEHEDLNARIFDIEQQTVMAFSEAPGSNAYLTRDYVGRVLYNCLVLGKKLVLRPLALSLPPAD